MSFIAVSAVVGVVGSVAGAVSSYRGAKAQEEQFEAQAAFEKASTEKRVAEEQDRASQNLLRAQEEKRKEISKQRAAFVKAGVLPSSPSADLVIGELGENLQTRIQDMFVQSSDKIASISSAGSASHFNALQNASAASRQKSGAIIGGITKLGGQAFSAHQAGIFGGSQGVTKAGRVY